MYKFNLYRRIANRKNNDMFIMFNVDEVVMNRKTKTMLSKSQWFKTERRPIAFNCR